MEQLQLAKRFITGLFVKWEKFLQSLEWLVSFHPFTAF